MSLALERITTQYIEAEDRIRLSGSTRDGHSQVLWLTQRLLSRLLPRLLDALQPSAPATRLASQPPQDEWQSWLQAAARDSLQQQAPVPTDNAQAVWLVHAINLSLSSEAVRVAFCDETGQERAELTMNPTVLRQWLSIVYEGWRKAEWPATLWPVWIRPDVSPAVDKSLWH